jgi:hypothetical protein
MWHGCWCDMDWLDADVETLHTKRIDLNKFLVCLVYIVRVDMLCI